jgi:hypothetical protein
MSYKKISNTRKRQSANVVKVEIVSVAKATLIIQIFEIEVSYDLCQDK